MSQVLSRSTMSQARLFVTALFGVIALISSSISPASAQSSEPLTGPMLDSYCEKLRELDPTLVYDRAIIDPQYYDKEKYPGGPDGRSWRCAAESYSNGSDSSIGCDVGVSGDVSLEGPAVGTDVGCSVDIGESRKSETVPGLLEIDIDLACAFQYGWQDEDTGLWYSQYVGDSTDWSDPYALVCVYTGPTF